MASYLEVSLVSVLDQLDQRFEVVVVDDGSTDDSLKILSQLQIKYPCLRVVSLERDKSRKLGATRNISVENAVGDYVILHIDADDLWEAGIVEWCEKALAVSNKYNDAVFVSGKQINFVSKSFFVGFGGYRNIYYTEDRDLWSRLAATRQIVFIDHEVFRRRLPLEPAFRLLKGIYLSWELVVNDITTRQTVLPAIYDVFLDLFAGRKRRGLTNVFLRAIVFVPAALVSLAKGPLADYRPCLSGKDWVKYRQQNTKTFDGWLSLESSMDN